MATPEVMEKRKTTRTCKNCNSNLAGDEKTCHNCGSGSVKKITIVVRKTAEDESPSAEEEVPDYSEMEDTERENAPPEQDAAERAGVVKENSDEDDYDEYEDDEEEEAVRMTKNLSEIDRHAIGAEAAVILLSTAEKVIKSLTSEDAKDDYDEAMNDANNALDVAFEEWVEGDTVEKTGDKLAMLKQKRKLLQRKLALLTGGGMDEEDDVEKSHDIYKGLSPEVESRLRKADELVEKSAVAEWEGIAKSFSNVPTDYAALGVALRAINEKTPEAYQVVKSVLDAVNANLEDSGVFKALGKTGVQTSNDSDTEALAKSWVEAGKYDTIEQARVAVMDANPDKFYQPTNR